MTKLETKHILQEQVCGCISALLKLASSGLPHQKTKRETIDAS